MPPITLFPSYFHPCSSAFNVPRRIQCVLFVIQTWYVTPIFFHSTASYGSQDKSQILSLAYTAFHRLAPYFSSSTDCSPDTDFCSGTKLTSYHRNFHVQITLLECYSPAPSQSLFQGLVSDLLSKPIFPLHAFISISYLPFKALTTVLGVSFVCFLWLLDYCLWSNLFKLHEVHFFSWRYSSLQWWIVGIQKLLKKFIELTARGNKTMSTDSWRKNVMNQEVTLSFNFT